jgi:hypothetical protein
MALTVLHEEPLTPTAVPLSLNPRTTGQPRLPGPLPGLGGGLREEERGGWPGPGLPGPAGSVLA